MSEYGPSTLQGDLIKLRDKIHDSWHDEQPPNRLFHYTSADGVLGILYSRKLWATHIKFLNDSSELNYGMDRCSKVLKEKLDCCDDPDTKILLEGIRLGTNLSCFYQEFFVISFCGGDEHDDDILCQWRAYGQGGHGYCLSFDIPDTQSIQNLNHPELSFRLGKVIYTQDKQEEMISAAIDKWLDAFDKARILSADIIVTRGKFIVSFFQIILELLCFVKEPGHADEREWRLSCVFPIPARPVQQKFRTASGCIIPYIDIVLARDTDSPRDFPLKRIRYGSKLEAYLVDTSLEFLLKQLGMDHIDFIQSQRPIR